MRRAVFIGILLIADQCFTPDQGCVYEPSEHALKDKWRLKDFDVIRPAKPKALLLARND